MAMKLVFIHPTKYEAVTIHRYVNLLEKILTFSLDDLEKSYLLGEHGL